MSSLHHLATTEIHPLSLHDALPISAIASASGRPSCTDASCRAMRSTEAKSGWLRTAPAGLRLSRPHGSAGGVGARRARSEEHTSELQSHVKLVCRLLLEKKKKKNKE